MGKDGKMNIYMIGPTYPYRGGIAHYTTLLFREFRKKHNVTLCAVKRQYPMWLYPGETDRDPSKEYLTEEGIEYMLDSMNPLTWFKIIAHIRKIKPDVVIIPWWVTFWTVQYWTICAPIRWFKLSKVLFVCHNVVEHESSKLKTFLTRLVLSKGDYFLVHSGEVKDTLLKLLPNAKIGVKGHPKYDFFKTAQTDRDAQREKYGFEQDDLVLLFFGFVRKYKGVPVLLDAMKTLAPKYNNIKLLLVGEAWHEEETVIEEKIASYGLKEQVVRVNAYVPNEDVQLYFNASDVAVFPYSTATASGALQIALAMDVPVIATRMSCFEEIVDENESGFIIPPDDPNAIVDAVEKFMNDGEINRQLIQDMKVHIGKQNKQVDWEEMADFLTELVESGTHAD